MFTSAILKQCQKCGMKFDNVEQLATHQKRFCADSEYGTLSKLELKNLEYIRNTPRGPTSGYNNNLLSTTGSESRRNYDLGIQSRESLMQTDITRIKDEKKSLRMRRQEEEELLVDLLREVEYRNDRDLRARIEKDMIRKDIADLEKLPGFGNNAFQKKRHLEELLAERELLKQKEQYLMQDIAKFQTEVKMMDRIKDRNNEKPDDILDEFKRKVSGSFQAQEAMMLERSSKINDLQTRRNNNEAERKRILEDREKILNGEFPSKRGGNGFSNSMSPVKSYEIDMSRVVPTTHRPSHSLLNSKGPPMTNRHDVSGSFSEPKSSSLFGNNANNILSLSSLPSGGRAPVPPISNFNDIFSNSQPQSLEEVLQLRMRYINGGGKDPVMLRNLDILENFYRGLSTRRNNHQTIPNEKANNENNAQLDILKQKEQEGLKLKQEIEMLKLQGSKLASANDPSNLTLANMNLRLNGLEGPNKNLFNIYTAGNEFFIQNEARNVDLNEGERMAVNISAQEADALRMLAQLPIGTELYRFKLEQLKELSTSRSEMDKILMEHMLLKMRRDFEKKRRDEDRLYENVKWVDEQRKNIIGNRLRKDLNPTKQSKQYDPTEGFIIHWDYLLSVPKRNDSCQVVYGIYINGNEVFPPSMLEPHPTEIDTSVTNRCIFGKSHPVTEIPANANALLIFEVQLFPSKDSTNPKLTSFGWSQLDLFDAKRELKRGKFKVPLYECPTDTNQDIDGIRDLTPVQNGVSWLYLRISYPFDDELGKVASIYPENTHMEYIIPQIHLRNYRGGMEGQFMAQPIGYMQDPPPQTRQSTASTNNNGNNNDNNYPPYSPPIQEPPQEPPQADPSLLNPGRMGQANQSQSNMGKKDIMGDDESERSASPPLDTTVNKPWEKKALQFVIHAIRGHVARSHLKISCALYEEDIIVIDDDGQRCVYNTTTHNPLDITKKDLSMSVASGASKLSNKAQGQDIIFKEDHTFKKDLNKLITKNFGKKDYYLMFQVLEKPEPIKIQTDSQTISYKVSETANYGGMEFELYGWFLFKLNKAEGGVNVGKFMRKMFAPGLRKPPLDMSKIKTIESDLEFGINEVEWPDDEDMSVTKSRISSKKKGKKGKKKKKKKSE